MRFLLGRNAKTPSSTPLSCKGVHRILVCRFVHTLGDSILITPLLVELSRLYPGAEIDIAIASPVARELFGAFRFIGKIHLFPHRALHEPVTTWKVLRRLRRSRYDLAIDPDAESQSGRWLVSLVQARHSLGFAHSGKVGAVTHPVPVPANIRHKAWLPVHLLRSAADITTNTAQWPALQLGLSPHEHDLGARILSRIVDSHARFGASRIIGVYAHASGGKLIAIDWWMRFLAELHACAQDIRIVEILPAHGRPLFEARYPTYYSSDVRKLAGLLSQLAAFVSTDCGIMHLASAAGTTTYGLFATTDPAIWGPYGAKNIAFDINATSPTGIAREISQSLVRRYG